MKKKMLFSTILAFGLFSSIPVSATNTTYTIQSGDTFWTLSKKFNVPYADVLAANPDADPYNLYIGTQVNIPVKDTSYQSYTIQSGDTFWTLSKKFNVPYADVLAANPDADPYNLYIGLQVNIPISSSTYSYTIKSGDTFWTLSQELNIPYADILAVNPNVNPYNLYQGVVVQIPLKNSPSTIAPEFLADGLFPLKKGSFQPFIDSYGDGRSYNEDGTASRKHEGIDIIAAKGTAVYSVYDGIVINKGWNTYGGWRLTVKEPDGNYALYYAHLSGYAGNIEIGSKITKGQLIGYVGDTGYGPEGTSGQFVAHLHLGMYDLKNGFSAVNPYTHLKYWESRNYFKQ